MTARLALMRSDNNATISLASMVGFDRVAALARDAGIKSAQGTPSMAIGSYDATPLDMAGAYTVFSNGGVHIDPWMLASVRTPTGDIIDDYSPTTQQVLDPRVAFLTTYMMEAVLQGNGSDGCEIGGRDFCGTGAGVRNMGFISPAAGKTGTSHDAWFAGFTSNLLCVVWVGNDDYTDFELEGAHAAAPIWATFMKAGRSAARSTPTPTTSRRPKALNRHPRQETPTCWPTLPAPTTTPPHFSTAPRPPTPATTLGGEPPQHLSKDLRAG